MTTAIVKQDERMSAVELMAQTMRVDAKDVIPILKATIIKPDRNGRQATDGEVAAFISVASQYGLNPITREIHAFSDPQRGVTPIVGIDGWSVIVNRQADFDGCEFDEVIDKEGKLVAMSCTMYCKGRSHPVRVTEYLSECKRNTPPWNQMPARMLRHKAFMQAARIAFSISGIYDEDEARDISVNNAVVEDKTEPVNQDSNSLCNIRASRQGTAGIIRQKSAETIVAQGSG